MRIDKRKGKRAITERVTANQPVALPSYTLEEAVDFVIQVKRANNLKERTLNGYVQNMRYFIDWIAERYGNISADDVTINMLREYVLWCANEKTFYDDHPFKGGQERLGISPASVNVRIRVLKTFFATLYAENAINMNPSANLALMRQDVDTIEPLSEDEIRRLLRAPEQKYYAQFRDYVIMMLTLDTGIRLNEVCSLEKSEIDYKRKMIVLPAVKNKNRKSRGLPLSTDTAKLLKQLITESEQHFDSKYVFCTNYGEQINQKTIQKAFSKYGDIAKITTPVSPHKLRHSFAKMVALNGMDIFTLMRIMGHADISTTRKYVQITDDEVQGQHARFSPLQNLSKK
jgi:integrase/recombinase XerD